MRNRFFSVLLPLGFVAAAHANPFIDPYFTIKSGVQDSSNMWYSTAHTGYGFSCTTSASDPATYINAIQVIPGATWDAGLTFAVQSQLANGFASNDYTLGTAMGIDRTYYWSNVVNHDGTFDATVAPGIYSFDIAFQGGFDSSALDTLYQGTFQVEVVNKIDATVTTSASPSTIGPGQQTHVSATLNNNMSRDFWTSTWFVSGGAGLQFDSFDGNWFDKQIGPGGSRTDAHSSWSALTSSTPGLNTMDCGVIGGLYDGDDFMFGAPGNTSITVTPEPTSMAALGLGAIALLRRRRKV